MASKEKLDWRVACVGLVVIAGLALGALAMGYNGIILKAAFGLIGVIIGVVIPNPFKSTK